MDLMQTSSRHRLNCGNEEINSVHDIPAIYTFRQVNFIIPVQKCARRFGFAKAAALCELVWHYKDD